MERGDEVGGGGDEERNELLYAQGNVWQAPSPPLPSNMYLGGDDPAIRACRSMAALPMLVLAW